MLDIQYFNIQSELALRMGNSKSKNKSKQTKKAAEQIHKMDDHSISLKVLEERYKTNLQTGLSNEQAASRLAKHESNLHPIYPDHFQYPQKSVVVRSGVSTVIHSSDLVLGDIVQIDKNMIIPADLRIIQCHQLKVRKTQLTGELDPQQVCVECTHPNEPLQSKNLVYFGTKSTSGTGKGVVIALGKNTVMGQIMVL